MENETKIKEVPRVSNDDWSIYMGHHPYGRTIIQMTRPFNDHWTWCQKYLYRANGKGIKAINSRGSYLQSYDSNGFVEQIVISTYWNDFHSVMKKIDSMHNKDFEHNWEQDKVKVERFMQAHFKCLELINSVKRIRSKVHKAVHYVCLMSAGVENILRPQYFGFEIEKTKHIKS